MKKVLLLYGVLVLALIIFFMVRGGHIPNFGFGAPTAKINNKSYKLIVAKTNLELIKGLSGRDSLAKDTGMLFIFKEKGIYPFWMKNMKFPIDIIFISDNTITDLYENVQPAPVGQPDQDIPKYKPSEAGNYVLELNANEVSKQKMKKGDNVTFTGVK